MSSYFRFSLMTSAVVVCACLLHHTEALGGFNFQELPMKFKDFPLVKNYLKKNPLTNRMTQGPIGDLIDLIITYLYYWIRIIILGDPLFELISGLTQRVQLLEGQ